MSLLVLAVSHGCLPLSIWDYFSDLVFSFLVAKRHQWCFVVVYVQREVQPVRVVVLNVVAQVPVVPCLVLQASVESLRFVVGLRVVWPGVDQFRCPGPAVHSQTGLTSSYQ